VSISETITIDAGPAIEQLDAVAVAADRAAEAMARLGKGGGAGLGADKLAASMAAAADRIEAASTRAAAAMGRMSTAARAATGGVDKLGASADAAAAGEDRLAASSDAAGAAMDRQAVASARAGRTAKESAGFFSRHKEALLGTAVVLGYSVDKAMKFNAQMTLLTTQAGVSAKQLPQLSRGVLLLAGQVGQSPGNLAESLYHVESNMSSLGISAPKALNLVKVAAEGASVGHANLVDVTNAMTAAVASGIPGVKNMSQAMGVLNSTVGSGDMSMQDLADAMGTGVLAVIKGYGANIKDAGAALATFGDNNIRGAKAGTDLRMAVQSLAVPASSAKDKLHALGLTTTTLADTMQKHGMLAALQQLDAAFRKHGVTAKNEGQVLTELFGKKAGVGLAILMEQLGRLQSKYPELTKGANDFGKAWSKTLDTPQQKLHNLEQGAQALAITAGNVLMPAASGILGGLNKAFNWIQGNAFASHGVALGAGGLVAGGLAKGLFSGVASGLSGLGKIGSVLKIPGADRLAGIGQGAGLNGAAANLDGAAARLSGAAAELSGSAGKLDAGAAGGAGKGGPVGAAGKSGLSGILGPAGLGVAIGAAIRAAGDSLSPKGSTAGKVNAALQQQAGRPGPAQQLHPYVFGGLEAKAATSSIGLSIGAAISHALSQRAPAAPAAVRSSGAPSPAFAGRFGPTTTAPKVTPEIDTGKAKAALSGFTSMLATAMHKPVKMPPPDISALTAAKGKAQAAGQGITQALSQAMHKPVKLPPPDLSAASAAAGKARGIGANISAGLAAGIESNKGAVVAAATDVANAAAAAMAKAAQTHSPSKKTEKTGKDMAKGLEIGLQGGQAAVDAAATAMGKKAAKAADIASIDDTVKKLLRDVPKGDTGLTRMLRDDQGKLTGLARQRARLEQEITNAQDIAKQAISNANITGASDYEPVLAGSSGPVSAYATISGMKSMAADQKQFAQVIAQLKKQGLNATSLSQIVQAGPSALPMALGLAQGGKGAIGQVNQLERQIHASAAKLGNSAAGPMYQAGVDAGKGLAQGIKSQLGAVEAAMRRLAQAMVAAVKHQLKSHSPSLVFRDIGMGLPQGLALGVDAGSGVAEASVRRMGQRAVHAWPGGGHGGHGGGGHTTIIQVQGHVMAEHDLVNLVQEHVLTKANNNWQTGWRLPGRAA
jgi:TP901 family phage tail tape measure protein